MLAIFDLDGFKTYNDTFGHPAGDALLARLGDNLADAVAGRAIAYRMGGDEFCVLSTGRVRGPRRARRAAAEALPRVRRALRDRLLARRRRCCRRVLGRPSTRCGSPTSACTPPSAAAGASSDEAVHQVLLRVAAEHDGDLRDHVDDVADLAELVGRELGLAARS